MNMEKPYSGRTSCPLRVVALLPTFYLAKIINMNLLSILRNS